METVTDRKHFSDLSGERNKGWSERAEVEGLKVLEKYSGDDRYIPCLTWYVVSTWCT
jgi:hypothetical protein